MRLYEYAETYRQIQDLDLPEEEIKRLLEINEDDTRQKIESTAMVVKDLENEAKLIDEEIKRLKKMKKSRENRIEFLKQAMYDVMTIEKIDKVKTPLRTVWIQENNPSVKLDDQILIPDQYFDEKPPTISLQRILEDIKNGIDVPGAHLETSRSIRVK